MHRRALLFTFFTAVVCSSVVVPLAACSSSDADVPRLDVEPEDRDAAKRPDTKAPKPVDEGGSTPDAGSGPGRVYAHTTDTLYLYEPLEGALTAIGKFSCLTSANEDVIDLAVDRTGNMYATTFERFLSVDPITAKCSEIAVARDGADEEDYPNALSFVPAGTVDPTKEALVGYAALGSNIVSVDYVRIDVDGPTRGAMTKIGNLNPTSTGVQYKSSGDLVSLIQDGNRTYLTVRAIDGSGTDLLAEVDPKTGSIKRIIGDTKQNNLFGFGYWAGKGYGFSDEGRIIQIDMTNGSSSVLKTLTGDGGAAVPWYGAGVTTQAPVN
jgi:hypothetical protein